MIIGLGNDLVDIRRIQNSFDRFGQRFLQRIYTKAEIEYAVSHKNFIAKLAQRWAAKEACAKALKTGIRGVVTFRSMEVLKQPQGSPYLRLNGGAKALLESQMPSGYIPVIHLSMSDEYPIASAVVIISAQHTQAHDH